MVVRSRTFWGPTLITVAATFVQLYEVPADRVARFSLLEVCSVGGSPRTVYLATGANSGVLVPLASLILGPSASAELCRGLVLTEGVKVWGYASAANEITTTGSGSLLLGDPS